MRAAALLLAALAGCDEVVDACAGVDGACISAHVDSLVTPLDELALGVTTLGERRTPVPPATLQLPVRFAIRLPAAAPDEVTLSVDGFRAGVRLASASAGVVLGPSRHAAVSLTLQPAAPFDLGDDLAVPPDLAAADLAAADLAVPDLATPDLAMPDLAPAADLYGLAMLNVVVTLHNGASGAVNVSPTSGAMCGTNCWLVPVGTNVAITPAPSSGSQLVAISGACAFSQSATQCNLLVNGDRTVLASFELITTPPLNRVFVTSTTYDVAGLGAGGSSADAACQARATIAGLANASGYRAYLSTTSSVAATALSSARGWIRLDGLPFVDRVVDIGTGHILYPAVLDELGALVSSNVWTGTNPDGSLGNNCSDWSTSTGNVTLGNSLGGSNGWTADLPAPPWCDRKLPLYCFGTAAHIALNMTSVARDTRLAFGLRSNVLSGNQGVSKADQFCNAEAGAAAVPGTFHAFLNTSAAGGLARFDLLGGTWARRDGVLLAGLPSHFDPLAATVDTGAMLAPIDKGADGTPLAADFLWVGGTMGTCSDWSSANGGLSANVAYTGRLSDFPSGVGCNAAQPVICLQD